MGSRTGSYLQVERLSGVIDISNPIQRINLPFDGNHLCAPVIPKQPLLPITRCADSQVLLCLETDQIRCPSVIVPILQARSVCSEFDQVRIPFRAELVDCFTERVDHLGILWVDIGWVGEVDVSRRGVELEYAVLA